MHILHDLSSVGHKFHGGVITIGNFDGLHLGHQMLLKKALALGKPLAVLTFAPHPVQVLYPERGLRCLFPREDLYERMPDFGVDVLAVLPFDRELASWSAQRFLQDCVWRPFAPQHIVAGYDFAFGKSREGTLQGLREWGRTKAVNIHQIEPLMLGGEIVSSRRIREALAAGRVEDVRLCLGRPFYLRGQIVSGAGRGESLGFPTLNQQVINESYPARGVYATYTLHKRQRYRSVTNIGINPTFGGQELKFETHLLNASIDLYGQSVDVEFIAFLRPELQFSDVEGLKKQIANDILKANEALDRDCP